MRGLLVIGAAHGAGETQVAAAAAAAIGRGGVAARAVAAVALGGSDAEALHAYAATASPLVAARHEGAEIDPGPLVLRLREAGGGGAVVATAGGGVLAPLTPRYAVRDLARELRLPVLLAVAAGPDATALARLSVEAVRGAGLPVVGVVLTGWPDPPNRVLLDERKLLGELTGLEVRVLGRGSAAVDEAAREWPAGRWLDAAAGASGAPATASGGVAGPTVAAAPPVATATRAAIVLEPYEEWAPTPQGDPRATPRPRIMEAIHAIVAAEGPILASRAYALYNKAAGGKKLTSIARAPLSSAVYWLAREGRVVLAREEEIPWQRDDLVRLPDTPAIRVRELGPRALDEVPLDEIAELMARLRSAHGTSDGATLKRLTLETYGLKRLTARADEYLGTALGL